MWLRISLGKGGIISVSKFLYIELLRFVWVSILAVGGGSIGLLLGKLTMVKVLNGRVSRNEFYEYL